MNTCKHLFGNTFILFALLSACAKSPEAPQVNQSELVLPSFEEILPDANTNNPPLTISDPTQAPEPGTLRAELTRFNITLSQREWQQITEIMQAEPSGEWAQSQSKSAAENLSANFQRFAPLFTPAIRNEQEYLQRAIRFAQNGKGDFYLDLQYYLDNQRILMAKWNNTNGEFVVIQADGSLVNYLITGAVAPPRYLKAIF